MKYSALDRLEAEEAKDGLFLEYGTFKMWKLFPPICPFISFIKASLSLYSSCIVFTVLHSKKKKPNNEGLEGHKKDAQDFS